MSEKAIGWEGRLVAYLRECSTQSFRPGTLDCGLFAGGAVRAMTGRDVTKGLRYRTIKGGLAQMQKRGHIDHVEYAASLFDELPSPLMAQRGDLAALRDDEGHLALGVVQGESVYMMGLQGIGMAPLTRAERAFRV